MHSTRELGTRSSLYAKPLIYWLLCAAFIAAPSLINAKPFLFFDSAQYFEVGRAIVAKAAPTLASALDPANEVAPQAPTADAQLTDASDQGGLAAIAGGRAPTYATLLYVIGSVFSLYGIVALQSLLAAWLVLRFLDLSVGDNRLRYKLIIVAALAFTTPLGFHAGFAMPDMFAGLYVLAAMLLSFHSAAGRWERLMLGGLLLLSATMHSTIPILGAAILALLLFAARFAPQLSINPTAKWWVTGSIVVSFAMSAAFATLVKQVSGDEIGSPPYLMARVIADGPGERLLAERCDELRFAACAFRGIDYADHNDFLWGGNGSPLNFAAADPTLQEVIREEEQAFVLQAVASYPLQQIWASLQNAMLQFVYVGVSENAFGAERMALEPDFAEHGVLNLTPNLQHCSDRGEQCLADTGLRRMWSLLVSSVTLSSLAALIAVLWLERARLLQSSAPQDENRRRLLIMGAVLVFVLIVNAVICGAISGPHDRYQARIAWIGLLVLGALAYPLLVQPKRDLA